MLDTMRFPKSYLAVFLLIVIVTSGLPISFAGSVGPVPVSAASSAPTVVPTASAAPPVVQSGPVYNLLLQDDSNGATLRWNSTTGEYLYTRCSDGFALTGTGTVNSIGSTFTLSHTPPDRRVQATLNNSQHSGTATIQYPLNTGSQTITDRSTTPNPGASDAIAPQVGITGPNGGEIVDTRSSFPISWESTDEVGVVSHDLFFSTDGGNTFTTIVTGLPGNVNQYSWTVPLMVNNRNVRVRVVARDAGCNASRSDSSANFTVWNPPASFTHQAEAPLFVAGQGFTSTIYMTNTSSNAVVVELDPHQTTGNATQNLPYQVLLNAGASATVDTGSLYSIGASPENPAFPDMVEGGIRLRHNGSQDKDVRALIVVERNCDEQFTTPFTYATSSLSSTGTLQCSPMFYVDDSTDAYVSFQNVTNSPQTVQLTCNYGTGAAGTPNGRFKNSPIMLGPQQTTIVNLKSIWAQFNGSEWGSIDVITSNPRSVICHSVMMSAEKGIAWDCPFVDPAMSSNTTKVAQTVMLDYNSSQNAYIMVCNKSSNNRTVTASFNTINGVSIAPVQVTLAPGAQQMISLYARQILSPGASTIADVRLTYSGSASDIAAAGCSMTANEDHAVAMKFNEPSPNDGRRLTSPYFRFDEDVSGSVLVSNLGSTAIKAGAQMVFANSTSRKLKTPAITIQPGAMALIDLSSLGESLADDVVATGRIDLIHSGQAGTVTAAVTESGCYNSEQVVPLEGGVTLDPLALFPIAAVILPGGCTEADAITDGTVTNPSISTPSGCFGTLIGTFQNGPYTFQATLCVPISCVGEVPVTYTPPGGGGGDGGSGGDEVIFAVVQASSSDFSTPLGGRLNPDGTTPFTLTANKAFPNSLLQVEFVGKSGSVFTQVQGDGKSTSITGTGPVNHTYLGNVKKIRVTQLNPDGTPNTSVPLFLKKKNPGAYFALDKPTSITSVTPSAVPVTGGTVTIRGSGFQTWVVGGTTKNPTVLIGKENLSKHDQIPFTVVSVPDSTTIIGNVGPTPDSVSPCAIQGVTPCKNITVINPGGSDGEDNLTSPPLLTINPPPPPVITGTAALNTSGNAGPATSNSIGMQNFRTSGGRTVATPVTARINGRNLNRVQSITFGTQQVAVGPSNIKSNGTRIEVNVPSFCVTGTQASVAVIADDGINPTVSFSNGWIYTTTGPIQVFLDGFLNKIVYVVGPCENVNIFVTTWQAQAGEGFLDGSSNCSFSNPLNAACARISWSFEQRIGITSLFPNANFGLLSWTTSCASCAGPPGTQSSGTFLIEAFNTTSNTRAPVLCQSASCRK